MRQLDTSQPGRLEDEFVVGLYHKSKRNFWNPQDLEFTQDRHDWASLSEANKRFCCIYRRYLWVAKRRSRWTWPPIYCM